jgi:hypothetical protein
MNVLERNPACHVDGTPADSCIFNGGLRRRFRPKKEKTKNCEANLDIDLSQ